jgi:hypothetical protein
MILYSPSNIYGLLFIKRTGWVYNGFMSGFLSFSPHRRETYVHRKRGDDKKKKEGWEEDPP